ncbi:hypothetical protein BOTBODRAFT_27466 [Botryobasidium botryosum FD-172 SS1]|uniref:Uncharacterized protein n=1 Tax=Botryobasidium botryosum (strain FD-172 SS1) TaxID=930990 RepID=A0A067MWQ8_BOTB1|nr:hypothetical protein BOTBODRAFT_27466 [Botryobasidium botryosum FD-172 SS1]
MGIFRTRLVSDFNIYPPSSFFSALDKILGRDSDERPRGRGKSSISEPSHSGRDAPPPPPPPPPPPRRCCGAAIVLTYHVFCFWAQDVVIVAAILLVVIGSVNDWRKGKQQMAIKCAEGS